MTTRQQSLALSGSPGSVAALLIAASAASRIARMAASDDGQTVSFDLIPEAVANGAVEYNLADDSNDVPSTSIIIAIPNTEGQFLVVEDVRMTELAAECVVATAAQLYAEGQISGSSAEIYAPTPLAAYDRISVRDSSGQQCAEVQLDGIDGQIRVTAATVYSDQNKTNPVIAIAAIGQPKVYAIDPSNLKAILAFKLDSPIVRATRSDSDGSVNLKLEDGRIANVIVDETGKLALVGIQDAKTDEVPTEAQGWQSIGLTRAIVDADGAPTQAYVKPAADSVSYRFAPQVSAPQ